MIALPSRLVVPTVHTKVDGEGVIADAKFQTNVDKLANELHWYAETLADKKRDTGAPN